VIRAFKAEIQALDPARNTRVSSTLEICPEFNSGQLAMDKVCSIVTQE